MSSNVFASNVWYSGNVTVAGTTSLSGTRTVQAFPPAALTGYLTTLSGSYGVGNYVASASNEFDSSTNALWHTFDKSTSSIWTGDGSSYTSGNYTKSPAVTTVDINGTAYQGEWVQLQMPSSVVLSSYQVAANGTTGPRQFYLFGSRDGVSWTLVDQRSAQTTWTSGVYVSYSVSSSQAFTYFRFVTNQTNGSSSYVQIQEIIYNGSIQGAAFTADGRVGLGVVNPTRALEVAGDVVCAGTLSAGNPLTFRNALYNGDMRINQRGISTNWASPTAVGATNIYALDRWNIFRASYQTGACVAQGTLATTDAPYSQGLQYYIRVGRVNGDTGTNYLYAGYSVETRDSYRFAGQPVTLSFWYRTGSGFTGVFNPMLYSGTGTDEAIRNGLTGTSTLVNVNLPSTNAWQYVSFTAFVPLSATQVAMNLAATAVGTAGGFYYFDITGVQLEKGTVATPYEILPYATELALCQRYYQKSYQQGDYAGTVTGTNGIITASAVNIDSIGGTRFNVPMRATPGTTIYSTAGTAGKATVFAGGADTSAITTTYATNVGIGYLYISAANLTQGNGYRYHYVADAEL